jgi:hypothetical protein
MKKWNITVAGWSHNASAHNVSNQIVEKINEHKFEMDVEDLTDLLGDLEEIIPGYSMYSTNMWVLDRPVISETVFLQILDEDRKVYKKFELSQIDDIMFLEEDVEIEIPLYSIIPDGDLIQNVLYVQEDNKGLICSFEIISDEEPQIEDITYSSSYIETPDGDIEILDNLFYKGQPLEMSYEMQDVSGKSITVELIEFDNL